MPRMRSATQLCPHCQRNRHCTINLDTQEPVSITIPAECIRGVRKCAETTRDKALLNEFEDGKVRRER